MEHESDGDTHNNLYAWYSQQRIDNGPGEHGNYRTTGDHQNDSIVEIGQNTDKSV